MLSVYRDFGVIVKDETTNFNKTAEDRSIYQLVEPGWLVVNRMKAWQGSVGVSTLRGIVSGHYICFEPRHSESDRFLHYLIRSPRLTAHFRAISRGVRPSQMEIDNEALANTTIQLPPPDEQRRIADFLDDRVSRIDRIIAARRKQMSLLRARFAGILDTQLVRLPEQVRASRVMQVLPGYAFASGEYSEVASDVPLLRGVNVGVGSIRWDEVVRWPQSDTARYAQFRLSPGDIVLGMDRPWIGSGLRIAQLTEEDGNPLLLQRVAKLIPGPDIHARYMIRTYQSQAFRDSVESQLTGLSVPHLSADQILDFHLPLGRLEEQEAVAAAIDVEESTTLRVLDALARSIELLTEYKSSLITAAVTGELDVTTAGSNIPG